MKYLSKSPELIIHDLIENMHDLIFISYQKTSCSNLLWPLALKYD